MNFYNLLKKCEIEEKKYINFSVKGITDNSKKVKKGFIFFSMNGKKKYIDEAIERGASAVITETIFELDEYSNIVIVENIRITASLVLSHYYKRMAKAVDITGVTGTNGKTTTSYILYQYLNSIDEPTMLIGTLGVFYYNVEFKSRNTTPSIFEIYHYIKIAYEQNIRNIVMEVSSHGLKELRVKGLFFKNVIVTNITSDHLDYHKNQTDYLYSKLRIFENTNRKSIVVLNRDDENYKLCKEMAKGKVVSYGKSYYSKYRFQFMNYDNGNSTFVVKDKYFKTQLLGEFNLYNLTAIIALLSEYGYDLDSFYNFLQSFNYIKGRMNIVNNKNVTYVIDFAHTFDAVSNVLSTIRNYDIGKLYVVIGCGRDRDRTKRIEMARVCTDLAYHAIFTTDNPRSEDPRSIIQDMTYGLDKKNYEVILDRKEAIRKATLLAKDKDYVAILGKGHEEHQEVQGTFLEFNDTKVLREILEK